MQPVWLEDYKLRMIAHDQKTFSIVAGVIFTLVALFHLGADLYGLASRHRGLVGTYVVQLDWPRRRRRPRFFRV